MIYSVKIDHPAFQAVAVHYQSMPYAWIVHIMQSETQEQAMSRWFRLINVALMDEQAQMKLASVTRSEFKQILTQYLQNEIIVTDWPVEK